MTTAQEGGEGSASRPGRSLPPGKTRYPLYRSPGGPQGGSGQVRKISPPPGFDPRTVKPVASRYTVYTTRPTEELCTAGIICHVAITNCLVLCIFHTNFLLELLIIHTVRNYIFFAVLHCTVAAHFSRKNVDFNYRIVSFCDGSLYDDSLLRPLSSRTKLPTCGASLSQLKSPFST
jgi:hypothetical protein